MAKVIHLSVAIVVADEMAEEEKMASLKLEIDDALTNLLEDRQAIFISKREGPLEEPAELEYLADDDPEWHEDVAGHLNAYEESPSFLWPGRKLWQISSVKDIMGELISWEDNGDKALVDFLGTELAKYERESRARTEAQNIVDALKAAVYGPRES